MKRMRWDDEKRSSCSIDKGMYELETKKMGWDVIDCVWFTLHSQSSKCHQLTQFATTQHNLPSLPPPTPPFPSHAECGKWHGSVCDHVMSLPHMQVWLNILGIAGLGPQVWGVFCYVSTPMTQALVCFCVHFVLCSLIEHFSTIFSYHQQISWPLPPPPLYDNNNNHTTSFVFCDHYSSYCDPFCDPYHHHPFTTMTTTTISPFCDHYHSFRVTTILAIATPFATPTTTTLLRRW